MDNENNENDNQVTQDDINEQNRIRLDKFKKLQKEYKDPFVIVKYDVDKHSTDIIDNFEEMEEKETSVAGRIMTRRVMGKASFFHIMDKLGQIQIYVRKNDIGEEAYDEFKNYDIGDIVGIKGTVFKTKKGEISVKAFEIHLLSKSLQVLPEKYHGLKDHETRYRQRYLDLIMNPETKEVFIKRTKIIKAVREFLDNRDYLEVETPSLQSIPGGAAARPFITRHNALDMEMYLRIALELPLKQLIVGGLERVYELGRVFRNEGMSVKHNPEFTMLELYEAYADYNDMMDLTEGLIKHAAKSVMDTEIVNYMDNEIDLSRSFARLSMVDAVKEYAGIDFDEIETLEDAKKIAKERDIKVEDYHGKGDILNLFFEEYCEEKLIQPTFIIDYPVEISPLTKKKPDNPDYTERFELFIGGREYANSYSELNDPIDQRERFLHQEKLRDAGDAEANMIDEDFLLSLEYGMPPTGGMGMGIDRLVMFLTGARSIRDVIFFPTMRPN